MPTAENWIEPGTYLENTHRWSGWPGAWCLDCGTADPFEDYMSDTEYLWFKEDSEGIRFVIKPQYEMIFALMLICNERGSNRFNPYRNK